MTGLSDKIWYGTSRQTKGEPGRRGRLLAVMAIVAAGVALRLYLPFVPNDSMVVYKKIVWAILHQQNWGKQSLVGVLEYPPLPAICLLVLSLFQRLFTFDAGHLMLSLAQVWTFSYLLRTVRLFSQHLPVQIMSVPLLLLLPMTGLLTLRNGGGLAWGAGREVLGLLFEADPYWVYLVPLTSILYHACLWERDRSLRDLVVIALACAVLAFGGPTGFLFSLGVLGTIWLRGDPALLRARGGTTLLFLPLFYVIILHPLFNWIIMGDFLFFIRRLAPYFSSPHWQQNLAAVDGHTVGLITLSSLAAIVLLFTKGLPLYLHLAFHLTLALMISGLTRIGGGLFLGGEFLLGGFIAVPITLYFLFPARRVKRNWRIAPLLLCGVLFLITAAEMRETAKDHEAFGATPANATHPPALEMFELLDQPEYWDQSRILIYNLRSAVLYADQDPQRFWARLDYHEGMLLAHKEEEQVHLLVPPSDGRFYAAADPVMGRFHEHGAAWLMLEKQWDSGWQLWRCVRPPPPPD